jgi:hypothetical protein
MNQNVVSHIIRNGEPHKSGIVWVSSHKSGIVVRSINQERSIHNQEMGEPHKPGIVVSHIRNVRATKSEL